MQGARLSWCHCSVRTSVHSHVHVRDNIGPVTRLYYSASTMICNAQAIFDGGKVVLGAQAGEARLAEVFRNAGFTHFRRAAATPFNLILEAGKRGKGRPPARAGAASSGRGRLS